MPSRPSKSAARQERQGRRSRSRDDSNLLRLVKSEQMPVVPGVKARKELVAPLNDAQRRYDAAMRSADIVFGIGPAGTGKTWFAAARAAEAFRDGLINKIVITRPAVEAGESLGFLPGELDEKFEPYFRPVREALEEILGTGHLEYAIRAGQIEARPLALLRGSTLKNSWVIADEMQNATKSQLKMLLSRIGDNAKIIVNGDPRQTDLPRGTSGLFETESKLRNIHGIASVRFGRGDIVRSGLCQAVIEALEGEDDDEDIPLPAALVA